MSILWTLMLGLVAGAIAKMLMPGKDPGGWIITALLGVGGSFFGGWMFGVLGFGGGGPAGLVGSVVGACALLAIYRVLKK